MSLSSALALVLRDISLVQGFDTQTLAAIDQLCTLYRSFIRVTLNQRWTQFFPVGWSDSEDERSRTYQRRHRRIAN